MGTPTLDVAEKDVGRNGYIVSVSRHAGTPVITRTTAMMSLFTENVDGKVFSFFLKTDTDSDIFKSIGRSFQSSAADLLKHRIPYFSKVA